jgi:hypothetical protein
MLLGLLSTLLIVGVLFVALKPPGGEKKGDKPGALGNSISQAQKAVVQSQIDAANASHVGDDPTASPSATAKPPAALPTATTAKPPVHVVVHKHASQLPGLAAGDRSRKILTALNHHKVAVVLFWTRGGADDDSVRRAVAAVAGKPHVAVFAVSSLDVGKYPAITTGVQITVSPTTLVIGPNHRFQEIVGYTNAPAITQAIALARR